MSEYELACVRDFLGQYRRFLDYVEAGIPTLENRRLAMEEDVLCGQGYDACTWIEKLLQGTSSPEGDELCLTRNASLTSCAAPVQCARRPGS
jgi:hypothetical protein